MSAIILPSRRILQPQQPVIDWGNPLCAGLTDLVVPPHRRTFVRNIWMAQQSVTIVPRGGRDGMSFLCAVGQSADWFGYAPNQNSLFSNTTDCTVLVLRRTLDTSPRVTGLFGFNNGGADRISAHAPYSDGNLYWDFGNATLGSGRAQVAFTKTTETEALIFIAGGTKGREVWRDGIKIISSPTTTAARSTSASQFNLMAVDGSTAADSMELFLFATYGRAWSDAECLSWTQNPWQLFQAPRRYWLQVTPGSLAAPLFCQSDITPAPNLKVGASLAAALSSQSTVTADFQEHRYWRINISAVNGGTDVFIADLALRASHLGANLAGSGTPFVNNNYFTNPASGAVDSNPYTSWGIGVSGASFGIDFGAGVKKHVQEVALVATQDVTTAPKNFTISYSDDGSTYTVVSAFTNITGWAIGQRRTFDLITGAELVTPAPAAAAQHWRIFITATQGAANPQLAALQWRIDWGGADQTGTGTPESGTVVAGDGADKLYDGNAATIWAASGAESWGAGYDFGLGNGKTIVQISVTAHPSDATAAPNALVVQNSDDGLGFATQASFTPLSWSAGETRVFDVVPYGLLHASPTDTCALSAALTTSITTAAALGAASTLTADLGTGITLAAPLTCPATLTADLITDVRLSATPAAVSSLAATLFGDFAALLSCSSSLTSVIIPGALDCHLLAQSSLTAYPNVNLDLAAALAADTEVVCDLITDIQMLAPLAASWSTTSDLVAGKNAASLASSLKVVVSVLIPRNPGLSTKKNARSKLTVGSIDGCMCTLTADLRTGVPLLPNRMAAVSTVTANLSCGVFLDTALVCTSMVSAAPVFKITMAAPLQSVASFTATAPITDIRMAAALAASASIIPNFRISVRFSSSLAAQCTLTPDGKFVITLECPMVSTVTLNDGGMFTQHWAHFSGLLASGASCSATTLITDIRMACNLAAVAQVNPGAAFSILLRCSMSSLQALRGAIGTLILLQSELLSANSTFTDLKVYHRLLCMINGLIEEIPYGQEGQHLPITLDNGELVEGGIGPRVFLRLGKLWEVTNEDVIA